MTNMFNYTRSSLSTGDDDTRSLPSHTTLDLEDFDLDPDGSSTAEGILYLGGSPLERMAPRQTGSRRTLSIYLDDSYEHEEEWGYDFEDGIEGQMWEEEAEKPFTPSYGWEHIMGILEASRHDRRPYHISLCSDGDDASTTRSAASNTSSDIISFTRLPSSSAEAAISSLLNSPKVRRDPWNISPPLHVKYDDDTDEMLVTRHKRLRAWNDPAPKTTLEVFDLIRQLLEGLVFFHEHALTNIPFAASNIMMDTGLALDPLDRSVFPVKYYLDSIEGIAFDESDSSEADDDDDSGEKWGSGIPSVGFSADVERLGALIKTLFRDLPEDPVGPLYNFMLSSQSRINAAVSGCDTISCFFVPDGLAAKRATAACESRNTRTQYPVSYASLVAPTAKSALEMLQLLESGTGRCSG